MGGGVFEAGQQGVIGRLLLCRQGDGLVFQRDRRIQVDGFVHLAAFDDALGAEVVQHGFGDAVGLHLVLGALSPAQQGHRRQLLGRGLRLLLQSPHQLIAVLGVAGELLLEHRRHAVRREGGLILRPIGDDRLDGLVVGAEGALLEEMHQPQQLRGRGTETEASILERLDTAKKELAEQEKFTLTLVNDEVDACAEKLYGIIRQRAGLDR